MAIILRHVNKRGIEKIWTVLQLALQTTDYCISQHMWTVHLNSTKHRKRRLYTHKYIFSKCILGKFCSEITPAGTFRHMRVKPLLQKAKNALDSGAWKCVEKSTVGFFSMEVSFCRALQTPCLLVGLDKSCLDQNHGTVIAEGTSLSAEVKMFCTTASSDLIGGRGGFQQAVYYCYRVFCFVLFFYPFILIIFFFCTLQTTQFRSF